jgi:hypothetical protein
MTHELRLAMMWAHENPDGFVVCEQCQSVAEIRRLSARRYRICPACRGYRFDGKREVVRARIRDMMAPGYESAVPDFE